MNGCGNEFPYFGMRYPDARCVDGYLWDLDSAEDINGEQCLTIGGDEPCPFCNTEEWLDWVEDSIFDTKEEALEWRRNIAKRWKIKIEEE